MHVVRRTVKEEELLRLLAAGSDLRMAATELKLSYWTVRKYASTPEFLENLKSMNLQVWSAVDAELQNSKTTKIQRMEQASEIALEQMLTLATKAKSEAVRMKAAQDLMDRDPEISRTKRVEGSSEHSFMNPLTLALAAKVAREEEIYAGRSSTVERLHKPSALLNEAEDNIQ